MDFISCVILIFTTFFIISISGSLLFRQKQNLPPSPSAIPIIGHLHHLKKSLHRTLQSLSLQLGPILFLKLGFRHVLVVSSPSVVEEIFTKNDIHFANRPNLLAGKHLGQNYTNLAWAPYGHHWRTLRRITSIELFSSARLPISAPLRREEIHRSVKQMLGDPSTRNEWKVIDLRSTIFDLIVNIMMRMVTGEPYFGDEMGSEEKTRRREFLRETFVPNMAMNLGDMFMVLGKFSCPGLEKKLAKLQETRVEFLNGLIYEGRKKITSEELVGGEKEKKRMTLRLCLPASRRSPR